MKYLLGIDGGGTKTEAVLTDLNGKVLSHKNHGVSNPNDIGIKKSVNLLAQCIESACVESGVNPNADDSELYVFAGIAGALNNRPKLIAGLKKLYPNAQIAIETDAVNMISSELPGDGACVICGTGNACFVRKNNQMMRIGGWGYLIDRGGDGYSIGRDVLDAALRARDGRGMPTILSFYIEKFAGKPAEQLISEIYKGGKRYVASFAPLALRGWLAGDLAAAQIVYRNAEYIAELIDTAAGIAGEELTFVMGGGINIHFAPEWEEIIAHRTKIRPRMIIPELPPVFGAVTEALKMTDGEMTVEFRQKFKETLKNEA